jgi:hypothetical protein
MSSSDRQVRRQGRRLKTHPGWREKGNNFRTCKGADITIVLGVNDKEYDKACTTSVKRPALPTVSAGRQGA